MFLGLGFIEFHLKLNAYYTKITKKYIYISFKRILCTHVPTSWKGGARPNLAFAVMVEGLQQRTAIWTCEALIERYQSIGCPYVGAFLVIVVVVADPVVSCVDNTGREATRTTQDCSRARG